MNLNYKGLLNLLGLQPWFNRVVALEDSTASIATLETTVATLEDSVAALEAAPAPAVTSLSGTITVADGTTFSNAAATDIHWNLPNANSSVDFLTGPGYYLFNGYDFTLQSDGGSIYAANGEVSVVGYPFLFGNSRACKIQGNLFSVSSGSVQYTGLEVEMFINQTGTASGITRTIRVPTTSYSSAVNHRQIETSLLAGTNLWQIYAGGTAQSYFGGNVGIKTTTPDATAALEVSSTTQGVLFPRMTTVQKNAISAPPAGLVVYDTTLGKLCVRTAAGWETITSAL